MVRYADGPTAEVEVVVDAPVERVWQLVCDVNLPSSFSEELVSARWIDAGPAIGARFVGRNQHPALGTWETTSWVTRYEPLRVFGWAVSDPEHPSATWWFTLDDLGGRVRLRQGGRMGPAPSGLSIAITARPDKEERIVARRLEEWTRGMQATVAGIKSLAEGRP
ncbi:MAG: SRPBCC family protein [Acidimicrobiales bacterium]